MKKMIILCAAVLIMAAMPIASSAGQEYFVNGKLSEKAIPDKDNDVKSVAETDDGRIILTDYPNGYSICIPEGFKIDPSLSPYKVSAYTDNMLIEIYYDDFAGTEITSEKYINNSAFFIRNNSLDHKKETETWMDIKGYKTHVLKWSRKKLSRVAGDKNHYVCAEVIKNEKEVYTVFFKSAEPIEESFYLPVISSFTIREKIGKPCVSRTFESNIIKKWNRETSAYFKNTFLNPDKFTWGIYDVQFHERMEPLEALERELCYKFGILLRYNIFPEYENVSAIKNTLDRAYSQNRIVELSFQTLYVKNNKAGNAVYDILDGQYDRILDAYAKMLRDFGHPVLFRLNNEMNGAWCKYSAYYTSKDTEIYKSLYRYIYNYFAQKGADNVIYIWNPNDESYPNYKWNDAMMYYPGDEYVDLIGLTGYNTGTEIEGEKWRNFTQIYDPLYANYEKLFSQPFIIGEFGSGNGGGSKEDWIREMFANMHKYGRIKAAVWWNYNDYDKNWKPLRTYRFDENKETLNAFKQGLRKYK